MSNEEPLKVLGERLMQHVRDWVIAEWDMVLDTSPERAVSPYAGRVQELLASFSEEQKAVLKRLIPDIVDQTIAQLLWAAEEGFFTIGVNTNSIDISDIREVAEGALEGYLYIWTPQYSKARYNTIMDDM